MKIWYDYLPFVAIFVFFCAIRVSIMYMHKRHPHEIHVIWLVFSFFFVMFFGIAYSAARNNVGLLQVCGSYQETCKFAYDMLTNVEAELALIAIFAAATVIPQILAYALSALSGSASAPKYIWAIQQAVAWSFIKFAAGLSGILLAQPLAQRLAGLHVSAPDFIPGMGFIGTAFVYAWWHLWFWDWWEIFYRKNFQGDGLKRRRIRMLLKIHRWCSRNVPERPPHSLFRRAVIHLANSDAVHDYLTQSKQST